MDTPSKESVVEAMRSDLGMHRVDDLELENGHPGHAIRPEDIHKQVLGLSTLKPPRNPNSPLANKWRAAIDSGEFDDDDAEAVKGLDKIGGGRLHALNNPQRQPYAPHVGGPPGVSRASGVGALGGGKPATRFNSPGHLAQMPVRHPSIPTGPRRASSGFQGGPVAPPSWARALYTKPGVHLRDQVQRQTSMPSLNPRANLPMQKGPPCGDRPPNAPRQGHVEVVQKPPPVFHDPEPKSSECFHKAYIYVADQRMRGNGIAYLLTTSPTDPGKFCIYLEGRKYLEFSVLDMTNYTSNSRELRPQFTDAKSGITTTTSMTFQYQKEIATFMGKMRTLKTRHSNPPKVTTPNTVVDAPACQKPTSPSTTPATPVLPGMKMLLFPSGPYFPMVKKATADKEQAKHRPGKISPTKQHGIHKASGSKSSVFGAQKVNKMDERTMTMAFQALGVIDQKPAAMAPVAGHAEGKLVDLSPMQSSSPARPVLPRLSSYAAELSTLDPPLSDGISQKEQPAKPAGPHAITREVQEALSSIEQAVQLLLSLGEEKRDKTVKDAVSELAETSGGRDFLQAMLLLQKNTKDEMAGEVVASSQQPKYSEKEIMDLRSNAKSPPEWLLNTGFLPRHTVPPPVKRSATSNRLQDTKENTEGVGQPTRAPAENQPSAKLMVSVKSESSAKPVVADKPEPAAKPLVSVKSESSAKPVVSVKPESSGKPVVSVKPESSAKLVVSVKPESSAKPVVSDKPESSVKPAVSVKPEPAVKPSVGGVVKGLSSSRWAPRARGYFNGKHF